MWHLIQQVIGVPLGTLPIPQQLFMMAMGGTGVLILITSAIQMIGRLGNLGGRR